MGRIGVRRNTLANMLCSHGEDDLAECALSLTGDELTRVGTLGAYYAWSEQALALGGSMRGARALSLEVRWRSERAAPVKRVPTAARSLAP